MSARLPDDLIEYLRDNKLGINQKKIMREIVSKCVKTPENAAEFADIYTKRTLRIINTLK